MKNALIALLFSVYAVPAAAQQSQPDEPDPQGAVLCAWHIFVHMKAVGERCFPDTKPEMKTVIDESIQQIETFILENSPTTREEIAGRRGQMRSQVIDAPGTICTETDDAAKMYRSMQTLRPTAIRNDIAKMLAVPRRPVGNPCL